MNCERQINEHLERALLETLFAIAEFDHLRAETLRKGERPREDALAGVLLMLRSTLDSAITRTRDLRPQSMA